MLESSDISEINPWSDSVRNTNDSSYPIGSVPNSNIWKETNHNENNLLDRPRNSETAKTYHSIVSPTELRDKDDSQSDFGSFESTEPSKAPFVIDYNFMQLIKKLFPETTDKIEYEDSWYQNKIHRLDNRYAQIYNKLTSSSRQYLQGTIPPISFRTKETPKEGQSHKDLVRICREWSLIESGLDGYETKDQEENQRRMNIFQWSSRIQDDSNKSGEKTKDVVRKRKNLQEFNCRKLNSKLLSMASMAASTIVGDRERQEQAERQLALKERREREVRLNEEKTRRGLVAQRYKIKPKKDQTSSKQKGFFAKVFGRKSDIAKDHISAASIAKKDHFVAQSSSDKTKKDLLSLADEFDDLQTSEESDLEDDDKKQSRSSRKSTVYDNDEKDRDSITEGQYNQLAGIENIDSVDSKEGDVNTSGDDSGDETSSSESEFAAYVPASTSEALDLNDQSLFKKPSVKTIVPKNGQFTGLKYN